MTIELYCDERSGVRYSLEFAPTEDSWHYCMETKHYDRAHGIAKWFTQESVKISAKSAGILIAVYKERR